MKIRFTVNLINSHFELFKAGSFMFYVLKDKKQVTFKHKRVDFWLSAAGVVFPSVSFGHSHPKFPD